MYPMMAGVIVAAVKITSLKQTLNKEQQKNYVIEQLRKAGDSLKEKMPYTSTTVDEFIFNLERHYE